MRIIRIEHIREILEIHKKIFGPDFPPESYYEQKMQKHSVMLFAFVEDNQYVGYCMVVVKYESKNFDIWHIGVMPKYRDSNNLTSILFDYLIDLAKKSDYNSITFTTTNENPQTMAIAMEKGFKIYNFENSDTIEKSKIHFIYYT